MGYLRWLIFIVCLFVWTPAQAQEQALLLDKSGSMRAYYSNGLINELSQKILALKAPAKTQLLAFSEGVEPVSNLAAIPIGGPTYLNRAISYAIKNKYSLVWMITDNIQSEPGATEGDTEVFYKVLRSAEVKKVVIFPILQPPRTPGIAVYALLLMPGASAQYEENIESFVNSLKNSSIQTEPLRMKPLDKDTVDVSIVKSSLTEQRTKPYEVGQNVREQMEIRFKSKFDYLKVNNAEIAVPKIEADFGPESVLKPDKLQVDITPRIVKVLNPKDETQEIYKVEADLGTIKLKKDFMSLWRAAFGKAKEQHTLHLAFLINVPRKNFKIKDSFMEKYNAATPDGARSSGKIYGIENLPSLLTEETTPIWAETQIPVTVKYPWWPSLLLIGGFLALIFIGGFLISRAGSGLGALFKEKKWTARATTESGLELPCEVSSGEVLVQNNSVGHIKGNRFYPAPDVSLLDTEAEKVSLGDNTQVKLKTKTGEINRVIFSTAQKAQEGNGYTPGRR